MSSFPEARIAADRLDTREFGSQDAGLVGELLSAGEPEAMPPGAPARPDGLPGWLADGVHQLRYGGGGVHLMMLDRAAAEPDGLHDQAVFSLLNDEI